MPRDRGLSRGLMTTETPTAARPLFPKSNTGEGRRLLALPGVIAVVAAMLTAAVSFIILLGGFEPYIAPDRTTTLAVIAINAVLVLLLIALIGREVHRIYVARRHGKAASRLHVRIVTLFSLVAAIP